MICHSERSEESNIFYRTTIINLRNNNYVYFKIQIKNDYLFRVLVRLEAIGAYSSVAVLVRYVVQAYSCSYSRQG